MSRAGDEQRKLRRKQDQYIDEATDYKEDSEELGDVTGFMSQRPLANSGMNTFNVSFLSPHMRDSLERKLKARNCFDAIFSNSRCRKPQLVPRLVSKCFPFRLLSCSSKAFHLLYLSSGKLRKNFSILNFFFFPYLRLENSAKIIVDDGPPSVPKASFPELQSLSTG